MKIVCLLAAIVLLGFGVGAQADVFNMGPGLTNLETVTVGDPGNAADTTGYGSVAYTYNIGKYEVTAGQYCAFLNAVAKTDTYELYNSEMWSGLAACRIQQTGNVGNYSYSVAADHANRPVNFVSFWDACRFANWLGNGQKTGAQDATTTERGAYTLDGYNSAWGPQRNAGWSWAVTSEDEWYKAAYCKGGGINAGYWLYPTQSNTAPGNNMSDPSGNNANYYTASGPCPIINSGELTTVVGEFQNSASAYGTFDQGGNVCEWNEALICDGFPYRGLRGGSCDNQDRHLQSVGRYTFYNTLSYYERFDIGFRVSQVYTPVPEPSSIIALLGGLAGLAAMRRRKA